jgi:hypothetical protein
VNDITHELTKQGREFGVNPNNYAYDRKEFAQKFGYKLIELAELVLEVTSKRERTELSLEIKLLGAEIMSYINNERRE